MKNQEYPEGIPIGTLKVISPAGGNDAEISVYCVPIARSGAQDADIQSGLRRTEAKMEMLRTRGSTLDARIDRLTSHADKLDLTVAAVCGLLAATTDSFCGRIDPAACHAWGSAQINRFILGVGGGKDLAGSIRNLEKLTKPYFPSDANTAEFGGGLQHHLRDFAHHPSIVGLLFSLLTQFTGKCYGTNKDGNFIAVPVKDLNRLGHTIPHKILYGTLMWFLHVVSDMAGTSQTAGAGTGVPGPLLCLAKEMSSLPLFRKASIGEFSLPQFLSKLFNGTLLAEHDENGKIIRDTAVRMDLRTELGMLRTQSLPVILNEVFVRLFYSARRFIQEMRRKQPRTFTEIQHLDWQRIAGTGSRTLGRMLTISSGAFAAADLADAAIRSGIEAASAGPGAGAAFATGLILRVNVPGLGRFAVAAWSDLALGRQLRRTRQQRENIRHELLQWAGVRMQYKQAEMWRCTEEAIQEVAVTLDLAGNAYWYAENNWRADRTELSQVPCPGKIDERNPGLTSRLLDVLSE